MKDILNPWVIGGAILVASILLVVSFFAAGGFLPPATGSYQGRANITVIPIPTFTITPLPTAPQATSTVENVVGIQPGGFVQISGTEGEGLRLRRNPSLNGEIIYLGLEGEVFEVVGGPEEVDGYLWWKLTAPLNETRSGWAVSNFLEPVQSP
jgi:hypothetical protein